MKVKVSKTKLKCLQFDCETVAAGFADPSWVPNRVTCIAWSWEGEDRVQSAIRRDGTEKMFSRFLKEYNKANVVVAHNITRFDLGVINADLMRLKAKGKDIETLGPKLIQDTMKFPKSKGFKKGLDDVAVLLEVPIEKLSLNHRQWEEAYNWDAVIEGKPVTRNDWKIIRKRCESDVLLLKQVRQKLKEAGMLTSVKKWNP